jgi:hypothetical protein
VGSKYQIQDCWWPQFSWDPSQGTTPEIPRNCIPFVIAVLDAKSTSVGHLELLLKPRKADIFTRLFLEMGRKFLELEMHWFGARYQATTACRIMCQCQHDWSRTPPNSNNSTPIEERTFQWEAAHWPASLGRAALKIAPLGTGCNQSF